jgi:hypothetical protein
MTTLLQITKPYLNKATPPGGGQRLASWACQPWDRQRQRSWSDPARKRMAVDGPGGLKSKNKTPRLRQSRVGGDLIMTGPDQDPFRLATLGRQALQRSLVAPRRVAQLTPTAPPTQTGRMGPDARPGTVSRSNWKHRTEATSPHRNEPQPGRAWSPKAVDARRLPPRLMHQDPSHPSGEDREVQILHNSA